MTKFNFKTICFIAAAALFTVGAAQSQTLQAAISFAFAAGNEHYPSGEYRIHVDPLFRRFVLAMPNGQTRHIGVATSINDGTGGVRSALVFNRYLDRYFLHRIVAAGDYGCEWEATQAERDLAKAGGALEVEVATGGAELQSNLGVTAGGEQR